MAIPAYSSRSHIPTHEMKMESAQLDLLSPIWSPPLQERERSDAFALSFSPRLVQHLIGQYSRPGDTVLDCFLGSGTTMIEAELMGRHSIGVDCNEDYLAAVRELPALAGHALEPALFCADARQMPFLSDDSVDLIVTQPPYGGTHRYSRNNPHDLSLLSPRDFLVAIEGLADELYRVLKEDGICALLIGDIKDRGRIMPLGFQFVHRFLSRGFSVKDIYDHRTPSSNLPTAFNPHEYLFLFQKKQKAPKRSRM